MDNQGSKGESGATPKKRKDKENTIKEAKEQLQKNELKKKRTSDNDSISYHWDQVEQFVTVILNIGPGIDLGEIKYETLPQSMSLVLPNGNKWAAKLSNAIKPEHTKVKYMDGKLHITVSKEDPGITWGCNEVMLENSGELVLTECDSPCHNMCQRGTPSSTLPPESDDEKEKLIVECSDIKYDITERTVDTAVITLYVKNINKDRLHITFEDTRISVSFSTSDKQFSSLHKGSSDDTVFQWSRFLKRAIIPHESKYSLATYLELKLKKKKCVRWENTDLSLEKTVVSDVLDPSAAHMSAVKSRGLGKPLQEENRRQDSGNTAEDMPSIGQLCPSTSGILTGNKKDRSTDAIPTCMVPPISKHNSQSEKITQPGLVGLENMGNTCFLNSVVQCLANTRELRDYFVDSNFQNDINKDNPLGMEGYLAVNFAVLLRCLWGGKQSSFAPVKLKSLVSKKAPQFSGIAQHDAQEFMAFLLDGLHEDLNRIKEKTYMETVEINGETDDEIANESWRIYTMRNDSVIVDLFQGQYKSTVTCPCCDKVSVTFDPFLYLSVPLPKKQKLIPVIFFWRDLRRPFRYNIRVNADSTVEEVKNQLHMKTGVHPSCQRVFEVFKNRIWKFFQKGDSLGGLANSALIFAFEVLSQSDAGENVVELAVIQRIVLSDQSMICSYCKKKDLNLKRCTKCWMVMYCDQMCQKKHWGQHKDNCKLVQEPIGCPFIISIPESQATYSRICHLLELSSSYSVDVSQPPANLSQLSSSSSLSGEGSSQSTSSSSLWSSNSSLSSQADTGNKLCYGMKEEEETSNTDGGKDTNILAEELSLRENEKQEKHEVENLLQAYSGVDINTSTSKLKLFELESVKSASAAQEKVSSQYRSCHQVDFGQQRDTKANKNEHLFCIRLVNEQGETLSGPEKEKIEDKGDEPLDLTDKYYLAMDWQNNLKKHCMVESKSLNCDVEESRYRNLGGERREGDLPTVSLQQCIQLFTEPERLLPEEAWYCPKCKKHREAMKQISLWKLPTLLIIQLKRFSFKDCIWRDKIDRMVEFPIRDLHLSSYLSQQPADGSTVYDLYGVINHYGNILGGHYTAFARCVDKHNTRQSEFDWRNFDDSSVQYISENQIETKAAYVLFYRRRGVAFQSPSIHPVNTLVLSNKNAECNMKDSEFRYSPVDSNILAYERGTQGCERDLGYTDPDEID